MSATSTATRSQAPPARGGDFAALGTLLRFGLRRDRLRLPLWIVGITLAVVGTAASFPLTYPEAEDRFGAFLTINNPGTIALIGALYGEQDYTYGVMVGHQLLVLIGITAALMSIFTLVRHTRAEEESGRAELVRSSVVGRYATAASAVILVVGANVVLAVMLALGLGSLGIETVTWEGSWLFGAAIGATGLVFAGVAAVTAQLTESARTASSSAGLVVAVAYVLRAIGDVSSDTLSQISPLGWIQDTQVYHANNWAPLGISLVVAVVLVGLAVALSRRRDVGAGVLGTRPGPAEGGALMHGPLGLTWRLNRGMIIGWSLGMAAFGLMYGPVLSEASTFLDELPIMAEFLPDTAAGGAELFGALVIAVAAILCAVPALQVVLRMRTEETQGRAGPLLSTPLSRTRWQVVNLVVALVGGAVVLGIMGAATGLGAGVSMDDLSWVGSSLVAALSFLPAVAVVIGVAALLLGWAPRAAAGSWAVVVFAAVVMYFGGILDMPQWMLNLSPFSHVPQQPAFDFDIVPLAWLSLVALVAMVAGAVGFRRRDIHDT